MTTKKEISETIRSQFASVGERARALGRALKARADIAASRHRLRSALADLGEEVYERMVAGAGIAAEDDALQEHRIRIDGVKAEVRQRERALAEVLAGDGASTEKAAEPEQVAAEAGESDPQQ